MNEQEVIALMKSSKSADDWNANCFTVKKAFGGRYPAFWYSAILVSGVADDTVAKFGQSTDITISVVSASTPPSAERTP